MSVTTATIYPPANNLGQIGVEGEQFGSMHSKEFYQSGIRAGVKLGDYLTGEAIGGSRLVWIDPADGLLYYADAVAGRAAKGFTLAAFDSGVSAETFHAGQIHSLSGLTKGTTYYLAANGLIAAAPPLGAVVIQEIGFATSATTLFCRICEPTFIV